MVPFSVRPRYQKHTNADVHATITFPKNIIASPMTSAARKVTVLSRISCHKEQHC